MRRGVDAYRKGHLDKAEATLSRAIRMFSPWKTASGFRAVVRMELGDLQGARSDAELAARLSPNSAESFASRGFARIMTGDERGAGRDFVRAAKMNKRYVPAYLGMAMQRRAEGDRGDALSNIGIAIKADGSSGMAYTMRGAIYEDMGRAEEAMRAYTAAIALNPENWRSRLPRARLFVKAGRTREALSDLDRYLDRDRHSADALLLRGQALFQAGDYQAAAVSLDQVIGVDPNNGVALANRGLARSALGDKRGAMKDLRLALRLSPEKRSQIEPQLAAIEKELGVGPNRPDGYDPDARHRSTSFFAALGQRLRGGRNKPEAPSRREDLNVRYAYEAAPVTQAPLFAKAWNRPAAGTAGAAGAPASDLRDSLNEGPVRTYSTYRDSGRRYTRRAPENSLSSFQARTAAPSAPRDPMRAAMSASILRRHGVGARSVSYEAPRRSDFPDARGGLRDSLRPEPDYARYAPVAQRYDNGPRGFIERLGSIIRGRAAGVRPYREDGYEGESRVRRFAREFFTPAPKDEDFITHRANRDAVPAAHKRGDYEEPEEWEMPYRNPAEDGNAVYRAMGAPAPRVASRPAPAPRYDDFRDAPAPLPTNAIRRAPRPAPRRYEAPRYDEPVERGYQRRIQERYYSDAPVRRTRSFVDPRYGRSQVAEYHRKRRRARPVEPVIIF
jgi:tetratricopeptide (TPR) repeat protein